MPHTKKEHPAGAATAPPNVPATEFAVLHALAHAAAILDDSGKIVFVNNAWRSSVQDRLFAGLNGEQFFEAFGSDAVDELSSKNVCGAVHAVLTGGRETSSAQYRRRIGDKTVWFHVAVRCRTDVDAGAFVMFEDRTAIREHYTDAVEANRILRDVLDHLPRRAFWKDIEGRILGGNTTFFADFGSENLIGKSIDDVPWPRAVAEFFRDSDIRVVESGESQRGLIEVPATPQEPARWLESANAPLKRGDGTVIGMIGSYVDVTQEHLLRETVEIANKRLGDFVATASDWLWECDDDGILTYVSERFFEKSGYDSKRIIGMPMSTFAPSEVHQARDSEEFKRFQDAKDFRDVFFQLPFKDGSLMYLRVSGKAQHDAPGKFTGYLGTASDVTDAVRQGNAAKQAQKLQAVGTLAAGVAHEFNNILSIIRGYADLAKRALQRGETSSEELNHVIEAAARGATLTKGLLSFGRKRDAEEVSTFDVGDLVTEQCIFLRPLTAPQFKLNLRRTPDATLVRARRDSVAQGLMNLVLNARDACRGGGTIELAVNVADATDVASRFGPPPAEGRFVHICVTDAGVGMDEATLGRIFEPFFTTKDVGEGTGLGLPFVYRLMSDSGGYLDVKSEPQKGAAFSLYFPEACAVQTADAAPRGPSKRYDGFTALVVDDESALTVIYKSMLEDLGFAVKTSSDPGAALEIVDEHSGNLDFILSDVLMPGIDGPHFVELATALHPEAHVLFVTGQPARGASVSNLPADARVLRKPITQEELAQEIALVFESPASRRTA